MRAHSPLARIADNSQSASPLRSGRDGAGPPLKRHLHKWPDHRDGVFGEIAEDFDALQRLYREAAARSEAVLVVMD
jgi:hypothetical protein